MYHLYVYTHPWCLDNALNTATQHLLNEQMYVLLDIYFWHRLNGKSLRMSCKVGHLPCGVGIAFKKAFEHVDQKYPRTIQVCRKFRKSSLSE